MQKNYIVLASEPTAEPSVSAMSVQVIRHAVTDGSEACPGLEQLTHYLEEGIKAWLSNQSLPATTPHIPVSVQKH